MSHPVRVPRYCDCLGPARVVDWLVAEGDSVTAGQEVCRIEADKVTIDLDSPADGELRAILTPAGQSIPPGTIIGLVTVPGEAIPDADLVPPETVPAHAYPPVPQLLTEEKPDTGTGEPEPLDAMRSVLARRMTESKLSAPHFYLTTVVDMTAPTELRARLKKDKIRATYNDMLIKAAGLSLREFPRVASVFAGGGYLARDEMNVGFAVATEPEGLVVPVIREADTKPLADIATETKELIQRARKNRLTPADYAGGVFTVSNLGSFDVDQFTAIVNPGESAILAVGKVVDTPVALKGEVAIRPLMKITLSSDHRVIDGALAARFAGHLKSLMQSPDKLV